jgi:predicted O-linked N-acetylglucosamine transferase (SPINDLY family)
MPNSQWCYVPWGEVPLTIEPHADRPDAIVFGSFNQYVKISDNCIGLWSRILVRVPEARLVVLDIREADTRRTLLNRLARNGIDSARVTVRGRENLADYFNAIANVDVALDTSPYNGGTTTFDTLWMGVPVVALRGERGISRGTYSILTSLQLPELIANSTDAYVDLNVRLARDAGWRNTLRKALRGRLASSTLMDTTRFVADLELGYRQMWRDWCASHGGTR